MVFCKLEDTEIDDTTNIQEPDNVESAVCTLHDVKDIGAVAVKLSPIADPAFEQDLAFNPSNYQTLNQSSCHGNNLENNGHCLELFREVTKDEDILKKQKMISNKSLDSVIKVENEYISSKTRNGHTAENVPLSKSKSCITGSIIGLEINCCTDHHHHAIDNATEIQNKFKHPHHHQNLNDYIHPNQMPTLCGNTFMTPTLSFQFSPFFSFSEDRIPNTNSSSNRLIEINLDHDHAKGQNVKPASVHNNDGTNNTILAKSQEESSLSTTTSSSNGITYADRLLLNAMKSVKKLPSLQSKEASTTPKTTQKKRKIEPSSRSSRQPQKRFSVDFQKAEVNGGDLFVSKSDGRVRLTTNVPRQVEAIDPSSNHRIHLYASCSEASRVMGINRTRMSRTCRGGGGQIGDFIYQYVEMSELESGEKNNHSPNILNMNERNITTESLLML